MTYRTLAYIVALTLVTACSSGGSSGLGAGGQVLPQSSSARAMSVSQTRYAVTQLATLGGVDANAAATINERRWAAGSSDLAGDAITHAALWRPEQTVQDLGTLGGANSAIAWPNHNNFGLIAGISETTAVNPLGETWSCAFFFNAATPNAECEGFVMRGNQMRPLPTLGGFNDYAAGTNDLGQVVGWAETTTHDSTCTAGPTGTNQVLQFEPVVWDPPYTHARALPTLAGDPDGAATATNDLGQVVGISGICDQAVGRFTARHAVLWDHGRVTDLGNFGDLAWNTPQSISNRGEVAGFLDAAGAGGNFSPIGFFWSRGGGLQRVLPLSGDQNSVAAGVNDNGIVVGGSAPSEHAIVWQNGTSTDLNSLIVSGPPLVLIAANDINDRGEIVGQALTPGGQFVAFLAVPVHGDAGALSAKRTMQPVVLPESVRRAILKRYGVLTH